MRTLLPLLLCAVLGAVPAAADDDRLPGPARVHLLDGGVVAMKGLVPRGDRLEIAGGDGSVVVDLADVLEAFPPFAPPVAAADDPVAGEGPETPGAEVLLVNGDRLRGTLVRGAGETGFVMACPGLGEMEVPLDLVSSVRFLAPWRRSEDPPPLLPGERADRFFFAGGDRLEGTLRSAGPRGATVRTAAGEDRTLAAADLLGFALLPLPRGKEEGMRVTLALAGGSVVSGTALRSAGDRWILVGMADGADRSVPEAEVAGLSVRGGRGMPLPDLPPASVEVSPYWGDDPPALLLRPVPDRALALDRGPSPPLRLGGRTHLRGLSMFSGTTVTWNLEGLGFTGFTAAVGVDDSAPLGAVEFEILVDGRSAWRSGVVRVLPAGAEPASAPRIDVSGAKSLSLRVHAGPGDDVQDVADWVRAAFLP